MEQADDVMASDDTSMTSVVSDGAVVTSRLLIPLLEEKVIGNPTIQKVLLIHSPQVSVGAPLTVPYALTAFAALADLFAVYLLLLLLSLSSLRSATGTPLLYRSLKQCQLRLRDGWHTGGSKLPWERDYSQRI